MKPILRRCLSLIAAVAASLLTTACWERPPVESVQRGYRGTGMLQVFNPRITAAIDARQQAPAVLPRGEASGVAAGTVYKNLQVLGDVDVIHFLRLMNSLVQWVAPEQGCAYCHNEAAMEEDTKYTKRVARRMLQMTREVNAGWKNHVADTGVTCYTCHRGQPVPERTWTENPSVILASDKGAGWNHGQNQPAVAAGLSSLPADPYGPFLLGKGEVRVQAAAALPGSHVASLQHTEWTYALMMHISEGLRVNCTYCHSTRGFSDWTEATPQRVTAWHAIRMTRAMNVAYLEPLRSTLPPERLGPNGDAPKAHCATCHQGVYKPLYGAPMAKDFPELVGAPPAAAAAPGPTGTLARILFDVGKRDLDGAARGVLADAVAALQGHQGVKVALSGYADRTGNPAGNLELAKQRAFAVRDALLAGGVAADRIELKKPEFVIGGTRADARRVDVNVAN